MGLKTIKRIASRAFKVGASRIKITDQVAAKEALTADDVRGLVKSGVIRIESKKGVGRGKAEKKAKRKRAGRRRGEGSKKGSVSRASKTRWIETVRAQRKLLASLKGKMASSNYRMLYRRIKGGAFKSKRALLGFVKENKLLE
ncbi:MAG: 50S ribosomal protein L19e [Candidatus Micrarchaeota archaeon]